MPELNPRRVASTRGRFAQVAAAVLAGMAAMFCLQNFVEFRREAALPPPPPAPVAQTAPAEPEHVLAAPDPGPPAPKLAASSMMLKPEPGIAPGGTVLGVSGEEAPPKFKEYAAPPPKAVAKKKKTAPHLTEREMESRFASRAVRQDGRFSEIKHRAAKEAEVEEAAPVVEAPEVKPEGKSAIGLIEKAAAAPENLQPAPIAQLTVPEREFWTRERKFHIAVAVGVMIFGLLYLVYATGIKSVPERAEGEL